MICQYSSMLVSDISDNQFSNVTIDYIYKSFLILGWSLPGGHEQHPLSDSENYCA